MWYMRRVNILDVRRIGQDIFRYRGGFHEVKGVAHATVRERKAEKDKVLDLYVVHVVDGLV